MVYMYNDYYYYCNYFKINNYYTTNIYLFLLTNTSFCVKYASYTKRNQPYKKRKVNAI